MGKAGAAAERAYTRSGFVILGRTLPCSGTAGFPAAACGAPARPLSARRKFGVWTLLPEHAKAATQPKRHGSWRLMSPGLPPTSVVSTKQRHRRAVGAAPRGPRQLPAGVAARLKRTKKGTKKRHHPRTPIKLRVGRANGDARESVAPRRPLAHLGNEHCNTEHCCATFLSVGSCRGM